MKVLVYRAKASAMFYALFLLSIVSIIIAGLFQLSSLNHQLEFKLELETILVNNSKSGLAYAQSYFNELPSNSKTTIRLFDKGIDSVIISKQNWGGYYIIKSKAVHHNKSFTKISMVGNENTTPLPNLYLADQGRPLSLCGETRLEGKCALPKTGVKRAYIAGENYIGTKLIYGSKINSGKQLPAINKELILNLNLSNGQKKEWDPNQVELINSFDSLAIHLVSNGPIYIQNQTLKGHILIESSDSIIVSSTATLKDVILKSPKIRVEEYFRGNFQCLASKKIEIKSHVVLEYPSVLGLVETKTPVETSMIKIAKNVQIVGSVFLVSEAPNFRKPIKLTIDENSVLNGFAYCDGQTQLKGEINGSLYTTSFYLKTASSAYHNHLLNAKLSNNLPIEFVSIPLLEQSTKIRQLKWLN